MGIVDYVLFKESENSGENRFMKKNMYLLAGITVILFWACSVEKEIDLMSLIENGDFNKAKTEIEAKLNSGELEAEEQDKLSFEIERMDRIRKDFNQTEEQILDYLRTYIPDVKAEDLKKWESTHALEYMIIDGEKRYFTRAARNLFRNDKSCGKIWTKAHGEPKEPEPRKVNLEQHLTKVMNHCSESGDRYVFPARFRIHYQISVNADAVPDGEKIHCWIPFPREIDNRQKKIKLLKTEPENHILADNQQLQRTIFMEKSAKAGTKTDFSVEYEFSNHASYVKIDPEKVKDVDPTGDLAAFVKEEEPHIVFTEEMKTLSGEIVGDEKNPYRKAQKIYHWIDENIPWASAREYSTIRNISMYPVINRHGAW